MYRPFFLHKVRDVHHEQKRDLETVFAYAIRLLHHAQFLVVVA